MPATWLYCPTTPGCKTRLGRLRGGRLVLEPGVVIEVRDGWVALRCPACGDRRKVERLTIVPAA